MKKYVSPWTVKQLFTLKVKTLEQRFTKLYETETDGVLVIKLITILHVRNNLCNEVIDRPCLALAREIFQTQRLRRQLKRNLFYFVDYFSADEWQKILVRLQTFAEKFSSQLQLLLAQVVGCLVVFNDKIPSNKAIKDKIVAKMKTLRKAVKKVRPKVGVITLTWPSWLKSKVAPKLLPIVIPRVRKKEFNEPATPEWALEINDIPSELFGDKNNPRPTPFNTIGVKITHQLKRPP